MSDEEKKPSRVTAWIRLLTGFILIWVFGWIIGPYIEQNVPIYKQIAKVVEERDIDSAAYMYTEESGSYESEYYLTDSFKHSGRDDYGFTMAFASGIILCFGILGFGWRYIL